MRELDKNIIKPDYLSLVTHQIAIGLSETDTIFSTASSFLYNYNDKIYLITNWHNVSGRNPINYEPISNKHSGIPDIFLTYLRIKNSNGEAEKYKIDLYFDKEMSEPKWFIHPTYKEKVDVVAIELETDEKYIYSAINNADFNNEIPPKIGDETFVIGYPFFDFRYLGLPIWKKASIATEPAVNENQLPKILIDTATRPGLSGSPVVYQRTGIHNVGDEGKIKDDTIFGRIRGFLGIYSGRIGKGEIHAQLGIVWKKEVIEEIIKGKERGNIEFKYK
ncbi:MAG: hypothetical protein K8R49_02900 [Candidatus Cloacimonetes bacterium]|nr:hypothetical protein [Candidatus Cloacimonadota bacterium]